MSMNKSIQCLFLDGFGPITHQSCAKFTKAKTIKERYIFENGLNFEKSNVEQ